MANVSAIFEAIRNSEMNDWVGGSDPEAVGAATLHIINRHLSVGANGRLLDFGCGVGRTTTALLQAKPELGSVVGVDIMPQVIRFCEEHIAPEFPNASFKLIQGNNDHYDQFIQAAGVSAPLSHDQFRTQYGSAFTGAYAFSVFTHVERADFEALLRLLAQLIAPGGELLITCFLLTPYSRQAISQKTALFPLEESITEDDGNILIGNRNDRLAFIAFDLSLVSRMAFDAGLFVSQVEFGAWSGAPFSGSLQDVVVCRRPKEQSGPVQHVPLVHRAPRG